MTKLIMYLTIIDLLLYVIDYYLLICLIEHNENLYKWKSISWRFETYCPIKERELEIRKQKDVCFIIKDLDEEELLKGGIMKDRW